jgi:hypothetical protein
VTGMGCEFRRTTSLKTEPERHGPQPIGFATPHPSEGPASERHLLGVFMASGSYPGNGPVLDPAMSIRPGHKSSRERDRGESRQNAVFMVDDDRECFFLLRQAAMMLADLLKKIENEKIGIHDPFEAYRKKPLSAHLDDW